MLKFLLTVLKPTFVISRQMENKVVNKLTSFRLPKTIIPYNYDLLLKPDFTTGNFEGSVKIKLKLETETNLIYLHSKDLNVNKVLVRNIKGNSEDTMSIARFYEYKPFEYIVIEFNTNLEKGWYSLNLEYSGCMNNKIVGFYSSCAKGRKMAASKFQPTYARQAFPCFDEPDLKATFDIRLVAPKTHQALSNMNELQNVENSDDTITVTFATSVPMSTYLAVFVVSDFEPIQNTIETNGIGEPFKLQSFARSDQLNKVDFAQDIGKRCTEFYIQYYKVPYPLPKLDMIAIPDYVSGATEHWGLITYRETSFLIDDSSSSSANKRNVANTIAHELAHMWFGNLVTMKWWDEVWLNEGFASYMQVKALNAIEPTWTMLDQFLTRTMHSVLRLDATLGSHPIVQLVTTPDEITAIFDTISYNKGASVLRMLEGFVGEEDFQNGVSDYLTKHALGNTVTEDLLNALNVYFGPKNTNHDLAHIMATWTRQMGFPLITVAAGSTANEYVLTQSRHLADPDAVVTEESEYNYRWYVPITYKSARGVNTEIVWFSDTEDSITINLPDNSMWLKLNNDQVGFYRVNYPTTMWHNLIDQLALDSLTISDRANLIDDVYELAFARVVSYELALQLTRYLNSETQYVPWVTASSKFSLMRRYLLNSPAYGDFNQFTSSVIGPVYANVNWDQNTEATLIAKLERMIIISEACESGLPEAQQEARSRFVEWLNNHDTEEHADIDPDLRDIVYTNGMRTATMSDWDKLWQIYLKEDDAQEKTKLRTALAAPQDPTILRKYIHLAWDSSNVRDQDYLSVMGSISSNPSGTALVWDYYRENWQGFIDKFTLNSRTLGSFITTITSSFSMELRLQEMEAFFAANPDAGAGAASRVQALENVRNNILWTEHNEPVVRTWLTEHLSESAK